MPDPAIPRPRRRVMLAAIAVSSLLLAGGAAAFYDYNWLPWVDETGISLKTQLSIVQWRRASFWETRPPAAEKLDGDQRLAMRAQEHCEEVGRLARLVKIETSFLGIRELTFECVAP